MWTSSRNGVWVVGVALLGAVGCAECDLEEHAQEIAGPDAVDCGLVNIDSPRNTVDTCTVDAFRAGQGFYGRYEQWGDHSIITRAMVGNAAGEVWLLTFDSNPSDQVGPRIWRESCIGPFVDEAPEDQASIAEPSSGTLFVRCRAFGRRDVICAEDSM